MFSNRPIMSAALPRKKIVAKLKQEELLIEQQERELREFRSLLAAEPVDRERLREFACRFGVPASLRSEVWKLWLGFSDSEKSEELLWNKLMRDEFAEFLDKYDDNVREMDSALLQRVRQDLRRFFSDSDVLRDQPSRVKFEQILIIYLKNHSEVEYHKRLLFFLVPFFAVFKDESEIYHMFAQFMNSFECYIASKSIALMLANFLMLVRTFLPDLLTYIEDEELSPNEWALPWLRNLLNSDLPLENFLRLMDTYLAAHESFDLHIFVCLAILQNCREELMEMEFSELKGFLRRLPPLQLDQILTQAFSILHEVKSSKLLD